MPVWLKDKLYLKHLIREDLPSVPFVEHRQPPAASAFYPSPFNEGDNHFNAKGHEIFGKVITDRQLRETIGVCQ